MIRGENIIILSSADWDATLWTNKQHIASRLAECNRVLYIESLGLRRPVPSSRDIRRIIRRLLRFFGVVQKPQRNVYVFSPVILPYYDSPAINRINHWLLMMYIKLLQQMLRFSSPILWSYLPNGCFLCGKLGEKLTLYHCVDDISQFPGVSDRITEMERKFLSSADITIVTSSSLLDAKKRYSPRIYLMTNVADYHHFSRSREDLPLPDDMKSIPRPIAGFFGAMDDYKFDFSLVRYAAERLPDVSFVLIGPVGLTDEGKGRTMLNLSNIYLLGKRDYSVLPSYLRLFDVCLIPFLVNNYTLSVFPMKLFEYLSSGKPVVATSLPSLEGYQDLVYISRSSDEFVENIREALVERLPDKSNKRIALAKANSWEVRLEEISKVIENALQERRMNYI
ncbi:glycosyltransferase [bacterium]|nr:glycosyltransferase [bacterium]